MPDKDLIALYVGGTLIFVVIVGAFIFFLIRFRNRQNKHYAERERLLMINVEESARIMGEVAKEVHDNIGQFNHLLYMIVRRIEKTKDEAERQKLFPQAYQLLDTVIRNADDVRHSLNSDGIKNRGFSNVIRNNIEMIRASGEIECRFEIIGETRPLSPDKGLVLYRIAQEAMHNSLKHAGASLLNITLYYQADSFKLEVKDNGVGFNTHKNNLKGTGVGNMKQRAKAVGGDLQIISAPDTGCSVSVTIPDPY